jgi:predicted molibdopterin-dependent oxidoreductase YjgC
VFGAGGGTSSYKEIEETDVILLWGSNARETHPIFFQHLLKGVHAGARLISVDPRRTTSAQWADLWLGLDVGSDIALSNAMAREIIHAGLHNRAFIDRATNGFEEYAASVEPFTLEEGERLTGVPADGIREAAHEYARADRAIICWTLGITEHHNAVDNVLALINLGLLCGHVGRWGSGLNPLRGQNNVQGGGDMGAIPNKLPGFQDIENDAAARERFEAAWGTPVHPKYGWHLTGMFDAMERGELRTLYVIGENPAQSEADIERARGLLDGLDLLIVQDILFTKTAAMADIVFPATASWCEAEGTVTNSERRVQRVRKALDPPGQARGDLEILYDLARRLGRDWGQPVAEEIWNELRSLAPNHAGMSYARLEELGGIQWPCWDESDPGASFLHGRLWADPPEQGTKAPFSVVEHDPPVDEVNDEFPLLLTTGRRLDSFNTGVQTGGYTSPLRRGEELELSREDADDLGVRTGEVVRITSRRGSILSPVRVQPALRPGLAFMTLHFPDQVETNVLTVNAFDPKSGTAEFKASAIRVERANDEVAQADAGVREPAGTGAD